MARGTPSMVALLGLLAVAGYQHRDKLGELLNGAGNQTRNPNDPNPPQGGFGDILGNLGGALGGLAGGAGLGGLLGGQGGSASGNGLGDLLDSFRQGGRTDKVDSWIGTGANSPVEARDLEDVLGEDTIAELTQKTGLSRSELLDRLSVTLPEAVDKLTPDGRLPAY